MFECTINALSIAQNTGCFSHTHIRAIQFDIDRSFPSTINNSIRVHVPIDVSSHNTYQESVWQTMNLSSFPWRRYLAPNSGSH